MSKNIIVTITLLIILLAAGYFVAVEKYDLGNFISSPTSTPWGYIETPAPSGCYYQQVQCIRAPCDPQLVCPGATASPDQVICTMEYAPVCGINGKTYSNRCVAEKQNEVRVAYTGECK